VYDLHYFKEWRETMRLDPHDTFPEMPNLLTECVPS
jgi:hypothetical protein